MRVRISPLVALLTAGLLAFACPTLSTAAEIKPQEPQRHYRYITLPSGKLVAVSDDVSDADAYRRLGLPPPVPASPPDFSAYKWGILLGAIALFLILDLIANQTKPLPTKGRWRPTMWSAALAAGTFASLQSTYNLNGADAQKVADLTYNPLASGIGAASPAFVVVVIVWFITRKRILASAQPPADPAPLAVQLPPVQAGEPFKIAGDEVLKGNYEPSTWARALMDADGDLDKAKAAYVRRRVTDLQALPTADGLIEGVIRDQPSSLEAASSEHNRSEDGSPDPTGPSETGHSEATFLRLMALWFVAGFGIIALGVWLLGVY